MRNNNLLKVFSGQQNKRYKLKGKAQTPFTFEGDNLFSAGNERLTFRPNLSDIVSGIWIRIWYIGTNIYNSPYYQVYLNSQYIDMSGGIVSKLFTCTKTGNYNVQYGYDNTGDSTGITNPVHLEEGKNYYAKFTYEITSDSKIKFSNIIISENDIPYVPYRKPLVYNYPLSLHSNNGDRDFVSMLIKGYTEKSGDSLLSANTPFKFTGENLANVPDDTGTSRNGVTFTAQKNIITINGNPTVLTTYTLYKELEAGTYYITCFSDNVSGLIVPVKVGNTGGQTLISNCIRGSQFTLYQKTTICYYARTEAGNNFENVELKIMLVKGSTAPTKFEPYRETIYNPTEGFSLNGFNNIYDTLNTINGELIKRFGIVDLGSLNWTYNESGKYFRSSNIEDYSSKGYATPNIMICSGIYTPTPNTIGASAIADKELSGTINEGSHYIAIKDLDYTDAQEFKQAMSGIYLVYELAIPQTYQKKPKTLPQWVKHVFDSSGRELEATITPITLAEPVSDTYQNANGKITRKTNKIELSIQNSVAQEYTGYSYLLKFAQPLAKPNTPILCDLENTNIVQDNNYLIVEYHNPSFTTQEQYYNYFLYEKHELIYERATYDTETIRSVMINRQYTKCTDKNGVDVEMEKA